MPDEIETKPETKPTAKPLPKGQHNAATMKAHLAKKTNVSLPNGETVAVQSSGIIFNGQVLTKIEELPTDAEIDAHRAEVIARRKS